MSQATQSYQVMPDMADDEFSGLKADIRENGVEEPIHVDENGDVIDGHHRVRICDELGIDEYPTKIHAGLSEQEKRDLAYKLNLQRRHLEPGQKREIAKQYLLEEWDGDESQKSIAEKLGVDPATVSRAKEELGNRLQVQEFSKDEKRAQARDYLDENPDASNREVAESIEADVSHATVGNWRNEWEGGDSEGATVDDPTESLAEAEGTTPEEGEIDDTPKFSTFSPTGDESDIDATKELVEKASNDEKTRDKLNEVERGETTPDEAAAEIGGASDSGSGIEQFTSQQTDEWSSPREVVEPIDEGIGGFDLDPASGAETSPFAENVYTKADDGLAQDWFGSVWCNPPYSDMGPWVDKAVSETARNAVETVVFLCKGDTSTDWWQRAATNASLITAIDGRLSFGDGGNAAPFASHLIVFGDVPSGIIEPLREQGTLLTVGWEHE